MSKSKFLLFFNLCLYSLNLEATPQQTTEKATKFLIEQDMLVDYLSYPELCKVSVVDHLFKDMFARTEHPFYFNKRPTSVKFSETLQHVVNKNKISLKLNSNDIAIASYLFFIALDFNKGNHLAMKILHRSKPCDSKKYTSKFHDLWNTQFTVEQFAMIYRSAKILRNIHLKGFMNSPNLDAYLMYITGRQLAEIWLEFLKAAKDLNLQPDSDLSLPKADKHTQWLYGFQSISL